MKNDNNLRTASILMTLSILLLVLLQAYWLRNAWFDEYRRLKRELGVILRETMIREEMKHFADKNDLVNSSRIPADSLSQESPMFPAGDSGVDRSRIRIMVTHDSGSPMPPIRNFGLEHEKNMEEMGNTGKLVVNFPFPFTGANLDTIRTNYVKALSDAGFNLPFILKKTRADTAGFLRRSAPDNIRGSKGGRQERFRVFNGPMVEARFNNPFMVLLKKIEWQLFFAIVMLLVTSVSFIFLYRSLRQQKRLSELRNDFIANITHELKTPISTVSVAIEALKNFDAIKDAEKSKEYLDISGLELKRLNLLVDKVLRLSVLGQQQIELQKEKLDLEVLIREVIGSLKLQFEKEGAQLDFETTGTDFSINGDHMHLLSVVYNLLDNALKYSPVQPKIGVTLVESGDKLFIRISDNGMGIAAEHREKIFEKFYRVPHGNTHNIKGYGLGLSYVYDVVKLHGGTIEVESKPGQGSVFMVTLFKGGT